jgi:hypothetical protein
MQKIIFTFILLLHITVASAAQNSQVIYSEKYKDNANLGVKLYTTININNVSPTQAKVKIFMNVPYMNSNCTGDIDGNATVDGSIVTLTVTNQNNYQCTLVIKHNNKEASVLSETEFCQDYHGSQCSFEGIKNLKRSRLTHPSGGTGEKAIR